MVVFVWIIVYDHECLEVFVVIGNGGVVWFCIVAWSVVVVGFEGVLEDQIILYFDIIGGVVL